MGWTEDDIESLYKSAANQKSVEFKDAYWDEMEVLLNENKSTKKRFIWWWTTSALMVLVVGLIAIYSFKKDNTIDSIETAELMQTNSNNEVKQSEVLFTNDKSESFDDSHSFDKIENVTHNLTRTTNKVNDDFSASYIAKTSPTTQKTIDFQSELKNNGLIEENIIVDEISIITDGVLADTNKLMFTESDNEKQQHQDSDKGMLKDEPININKWSMYVGLDAGASTPYTRSSDELNVNWGVKTGFDYKIYKNIIVGGGIGFRQQLVNDLVVSKSRAYYSFGVINYSQTISYDRLQFFDVNLHTHYQWNKMKFGVEFTPSYLISARAKMSQFESQDGKLSNMQETIVENQREYVQTNNLNAIGLDLGVSFQYEFKYKMSLEVGANTRLNKMLMSTDFVEVENRFPIKLEIGLIKRF